MDADRLQNRSPAKIPVWFCRTNHRNVKNICLAGGVALNCVANGKLLSEKIFDELWIQPASGDAGGALGAALFVNYQLLNLPRSVDPNDSMQGSYLTPFLIR